MSAQHWEFWNLVNIIHSRISQSREKIDSFIQVIQSSQQNDRALNSISWGRQVALWEMVGSGERQVSWESKKRSRFHSKMKGQKQKHRNNKWKDECRKPLSSSILLKCTVKRGQIGFALFWGWCSKQKLTKRTWNLPSKWWEDTEDF